MSNGSSATRSRKRVRAQGEIRTGCSIWMLRGSTWKELMDGIDDPLASLSGGWTRTCPKHYNCIFVDEVFWRRQTKLILSWQSTLSVMLRENILVLPIWMGLHWVGHITTTTTTIDSVGGSSGYFTDFLSVISFCPNLYCFYFTTLYSSLSSPIKYIVIFAVLIPFRSIPMIASRFYDYSSSLRHSTLSIGGGITGTLRDSITHTQHYVMA